MDYIIRIQMGDTYHKKTVHLVSQKTNKNCKFLNIFYAVQRDVYIIFVITENVNIARICTCDEYLNTEVGVKCRDINYLNVNSQHFY